MTCHTVFHSFCEESKCSAWAEQRVAAVFNVCCVLNLTPFPPALAPLLCTEANLGCPDRELSTRASLVSHIPAQHLAPLPALTDEGMISYCAILNSVLVLVELEKKPWPTG